MISSPSETSIATISGPSSSGVCSFIKPGDVALDEKTLVMIGLLHSSDLSYGARCIDSTAQTSHFRNF